MTTLPVYKLHQGSLPLLVSMPHVGEHIPDDIAAGMTDAARRLPDTDWHLERLYDFLAGMDVSILVATHSRYVIDLNRSLDNANLYPGQDTTGLCPIDTFDKQAIYQQGCEPDESEIEARGLAYWVPYHDALVHELARIRQQHGFALLWDAHSIRSEVPRFFEGQLPDFNLGTASGSSCSPALSATLHAIAATAPGYRAALNGRFKGGHITRHYGDPESNVHAVQLELSQATYMEEDFPYAFNESKAAMVRPVLQDLIRAVLDFAHHHLN